MSYEGREQHICERGHLFEIGCTYSFEENDTFCPYCQTKSVWCNCIDDTNCESVGEILPEEFEKVRLTTAQYEVCNLGHSHLITPETYRVPKAGELRQSMILHGKYHFVDEVYNHLTDSN